MGLADYIDVELHLMSRQRACLRCPDQQQYSGPVQLDEDLSQQLLEYEHGKDFLGYGKALFDATFPLGSELYRGICSLRDRYPDAAMRFRLNIDSAARPLHSLHWELLTDGEDFAIGRSPRTAFSRCVSRPDPPGPTPARPEMLCVIAAPIDAGSRHLASVDYDYTRRELDQIFRDLPTRLEVRYLERPATVEKLRDQLSRHRSNLLHVHGHGILPRTGESALVLEDDEGKVALAKESVLRDVLLGLSDLRLVTLVACDGGRLSRPDDDLSGLAGSLVRRGIPAVIAMRRAISMKVGLDFTRHFYRQLAESPCVDAAINEARHQLYLKDPETVDWSSPVLYMRLADGKLWDDEAQRASVTPERSVTSVERRDEKKRQRPAKSLKQGNLVPLTGFLLFNILVFMVVLSDPFDAASLGEVVGRFEISDGLILALLPIAALIADGLLPEPVRSVLVFWRVRNPLPGAFAFSRLAVKDPRVDLEILRRRYGRLDVEPSRQNLLWYRIYKKYEHQASVREAHRRFLLTRDMTVIAAILSVSFPLLALATNSGSSRSLGYALFLLSQYLVLSRSARTHGARLVCNVLAEESACPLSDEEKT